MGSFPHGGCGPNCASCRAGGESRKRSTSWTGQTRGKTKRSAEKVNASRNQDRQFLVRMTTIATCIQCISFSAVLNVYLRQTLTSMGSYRHARRRVDQNARRRQKSEIHLPRTAERRRIYHRPDCRE